MNLPDLCEISQSQKLNIVCDSTYMRYIVVKFIEMESRGSARDQGVKAYGISVWEGDSVLKIEGGSDCTNCQLYLKIFKAVNSVLYILSKFK